MTILTKNDDSTQSLILDLATNQFYLLAEDSTGLHEIPITKKTLTELNKGIWHFTTQKTKRHKPKQASVSTHCLSALFDYFDQCTIRNNYKVIAFNDKYSLTLMLS